MTQLIMLGRTIAILPQSSVEPVHPGLVYKPVVDAAPSRLVVAWSQLDQRPLVASFAAAAVAASRSQRGSASSPGAGAFPDGEAG